MIDFIWGIVVFIVRAAIFVLDIVVLVSDLYRFARWSTGRANPVEVPAESKILSPAARRALDEAEQRRVHAASGTVQAS
jgi:hypothetical protein